MLLCACLTGCRRSEIAKLHTDNIEGGTLRIFGKGKWRTIPLHPHLTAALKYVPSGYLFPGKIDGHLSADRVGNILSELLGRGWTGHTLRHRVASRGFAAERDYLAVSKILGHSSISTTQRYTQVVDGALMAVILAAGQLSA